ncbi:hypothetical protein BaRGS_00029118, partial [Batillaria attramentaria]
ATAGVEMARGIDRSAPIIPIHILERGSNLDLKTSSGVEKIFHRKPCSTTGTPNTYIITGVTGKRFLSTSLP